MRDALVFQDPPDKPITGYSEFAAALRHHPFRWAILTDSAASSLVTQINQGAIEAFTPTGHFEATGRTVRTAPRRFKVWVRYTPPDREDVTP